MLEKRERKIERERDLETGEIILGLESVGSPSLSNYGGAGIEPFRNHVGTPVGPHEPGVNNGDGGIHGGFRGVL
jgi:hypothetical protein